jgi:putative addiction module component (TIGR02574 family)
MSSISMAELLKLPVSERIRLVEALWDSIAAVPEPVDLSPDQRRELDMRWKAYERDASPGEAWSDVRARILRAG